MEPTTMHTADADSQKHTSEALYCDHETTQTEGIVRASLKREEKLREWEASLSDLAKKCKDYYEDFRMWEASLLNEWSADPEEYDPELHIEAKKIAAIWCGILRRMVNLLDDVSCHNLKIAEENRLRAHYSVVVSIEMMDHGAMPSHIRELAEQAKREFDAGQTEEMDA